MSRDVDFSALDEIPPEVVEALSPAWKRILAALRRLREGEND